MPKSVTSASEPTSTPGDEPRLPAPPHRRSGRITRIVIVTAVAIILLRYLQPVLLPFVLSFLLFHALDAPVDWLQKRRVPRGVGAAAVLLSTLATTVFLVYSLQGQAMEVVNQLPEGARRLAQMLERSPDEEPGPIDKVQEAADALIESTENPKPEPGVMRVQVEEPTFRAGRYLWDNSTAALSALNQVILVLFLTYFMLLSDDLFRRKLVKLAGPTLTSRRVTVEIIEQIAQRIRKFLLIQMATSAVVAVATWMGLWALGLEQAALWGLVAGVLNSIPYYGPLLVTSGLSVVGFVQFGDIGQTATVAGVSLLITTLEGSVLTPQLMGRAAEMNTVAVFAGLTFWTWAWGIWGLLLAVPMMMVFKVVCDHVEDLRPVAYLLGK
jgi:predicted PurR-regulated permease PerM